MIKCCNCANQLDSSNKRVCSECNVKWLERMRQILGKDNIMPLYGMYVDYNLKQVRFGGIW